MSPVLPSFRRDFPYPEVSLTPDTARNLTYARRLRRYAIEAQFDGVTRLCNGSLQQALWVRGGAITILVMCFMDLIPLELTDLPHRSISICS